MQGAGGRGVGAGRRGEGGHEGGGARGARGEGGGEGGEEEFDRRNGNGLPACAASSALLSTGRRVPPLFLPRSTCRT